MHKFPLLVALLLLPLAAYASPVTSITCGAYPSFSPQQVFSDPASGVSFGVSCIVGGGGMVFGYPDTVYGWEVIVQLLTAPPGTDIDVSSTSGNVDPCGLGVDCEGFLDSYEGPFPVSSGAGEGIALQALTGGFTADLNDGIWVEFGVVGGFDDSVDFTLPDPPAPMPEPRSILLIGLGVCSLGFAVRFHN